MGSFGWDYPPGVTGREPQISGEYSDETVIEEVNDKLRKIESDLEDIGNEIEDNLGTLTEKEDDYLERAIIAVENLMDELNSRIPDGDPNGY